MRDRLLLPGPIIVRVAFWLALLLVFPLPSATAALSFRLEVLGCVTNPAAALPLESEPQQLPEDSPEPLKVSERVLHRLEQAENKEIDPWMRDDIRIAWITVLNASRGNPQPQVDATYGVLGLHPDRVWPAIVARRQAKLGAEYEEFFGGVALPKRPVRSVSLDELSKREAQRSRSAAKLWFKNTNAA